MGKCLVHGGRAIKYLVVNSVADYRTIKIYPQIPQTSQFPEVVEEIGGRGARRWSRTIDARFSGRRSTDRATHAKLEAEAGFEPAISSL